MNFLENEISYENILLYLRCLFFCTELHTAFRLYHLLRNAAKRLRGFSGWEIFTAYLAAIA